MSWFRICMETPDDGAGGGGEEEAANEFVSAFSSEGWKGDVPESTPEPVEETEPEGEEAPEETAAEEQQRLYAGKYSSVEELEKAYQNAIALATRKGVELPEEPEYEEPEAPQGWTADRFSALGEIPSDGLSVLQRQQLGELMQEDPKAAAVWAAKNAHLLTEQEFGAVQSNWYAADPWGAQQAWQSAEDARRQEAIEAEYGPTRAVVDLQQATAGMRMALDAVPTMAEHRQEFAQWIEDNPTIDDALTAMTDPMQVRDALVTIFYNWYGPQALTRIQEQEQAAASAAEEARVAAEEQAAAQQQQQRRARTATSSAPAPPTGGEASVEDIRSAIRGASRGTVPGRA